MIKKTKIDKKGSIKYNGKNVTINYVKDQCINEPISDNICNAVNDYYNLMHLIKNSWSNKKYILKMDGAGYNIYDKNDKLQAWIGVKEEYECLMFIIFSWGRLYNNAYKIFKKSKDHMLIFDWDEDMWIYSKLNIIDILKEKDVENQKKIIMEWIKVNIEKIL
jgi:hypothetical protein